MRRLQSISQRLRNLFHKDAVERETDQELHFHLERQIAEHAARPCSNSAVWNNSRKSAAKLAA